MDMTLNQLRASFWDAYPCFADHYRKTWRQNQYNATIRTCWVDYVDSMARDGQITESMASRATL